ncbi:MAG: U32 family peptidase [Clostridiales bacterium]|nr:U32 family peptidase [Clostridiales bacterium]
MMIKNDVERVLELLAPARNADIAIAAIDHGADAVYIGASHHGARHAAGNSIDDIKRVVEYAHRFDVRVYVTLNTLIYDDEITAVQQLVNELYRVGVDALIVQDMALLEMPLPPIALHASTQCDIRTAARARFLQDVGFSQLVLARELSLDEIKEIRKATDVPLEAFVHGALCVSYSGNCQVSHIVTGRSANRGECAQMCRLSYDLIEGNGEVVVKDKHLLSLKDMNRLSSLADMVEAGIDSFKIEGRLKDMDYVKTVVAVYSRELDRIVQNSGGRYRRRGRGRVELSFNPMLEDSFNRGYTDYFLTCRRPLKSIASIDTPKSAGRPIGVVKRALGKQLIVDSQVSIANGDGLTYFEAGTGRLKGFRVNRTEGHKLFLSSPVDINAGTKLYRNHDIKREALMSGVTARRVVDLDMTLRISSDNTRLILDVQPCGGQASTATIELASPPVEARTPQLQARCGTLAKLGGTPYELHHVEDTIPPDMFIRLSDLASLRREAIRVMEVAHKVSYTAEKRDMAVCSPSIDRTHLDYTDNVSNHLSQSFYERLGATVTEPAVELQGRPGRNGHDRRVMLTRYCLRRELGYCLLTPRGKDLCGPLKLRGANFEMSVNFDCRRCEMSLTI